jgi:hypothetical protein
LLVVRGLKVELLESIIQMAKIFELTQDIKDIAQNAIDDLIDQLGKTCKLVYPQITTPCPNCIYDPSKQKSSNFYKAGGPIPFSSGICPYCGGKGNLATRATEDVVFLCQWNPRHWFISAVRVPDGFVQVKGYQTILSKVVRAEYIEMQTPLSGSQYFRYKLDSEPIDQGNIIQGRYFVALLKRIPE